MLLESIGAIADNLLCAMQFFGRARSAGEIRDAPGLCLISCGLNYAAFNAAVLRAPISSNASEFARRVDTAASFFSARSLRWTYWLCDDYLDRSATRQSLNVLSRYGLHPLTEAPGMYAARLTPAPARLPSIEVRPVADNVTRAAFSWITSITFEIPHAICTAIYGNEKAWAGDFRGYVGFVRGEPVTTAAVIVAAGVAGIYSVATVASHRRRGYADATMRHVLNEVKQRDGVECSVLQATRPGFRLYEKMGYQRLTNFSVYISG